MSVMRLIFVPVKPEDGRRRARVEAGVPGAVSGKCTVSPLAQNISL
jgi:hypothetical protein